MKGNAMKRAGKPGAVMAAVAILVVLLFLLGKKLSAVYEDVTGLSRLHFHEREVVEEALREEFPDEEPVLSGDYTETRTRRSWTFQLKNYPGLTFHVESIKTGDMLPFLYNMVTLRNNAYTTVAETVLSDFEVWMKENEPADMAGFWKGVVYKGYPRGGFQRQDEDPEPDLYVGIEFTDKSEIEKSRKLMDDCYDFLHREAPMLSDIGFRVKMQLDKKYSLYGGYYFDRVDVGSVKDKRASIVMSIWGQEDLDRYVEDCERSLYRYYVLMADTGDGVTEEDKAKFAEEYVDIGADGVHYLKGEGEAKALPSLWLSIRGKDYIAQKSQDEKFLFIFVPEAWQIFSDCGLQPHGDRSKFDVIGADGEKYHFSPDLEYGNTSAEINDPFVVDDALVKKICGVDLWESIVREP